MKTRLVVAMLGVWLAIGVAEPAAADRSPDSKVPEWVEAVARIMAAKEAGLLSADDAAELKFIAITDLSRLPAEFRSSSASVERLVRPESDEPSARGLVELATKLDALFSDDNEWSPQARMHILNSFADASSYVRPALADLPKTKVTTHFIIHWTDQGTDAPPGGEAYVQAVADSLEAAWSRLNGAGYGYEMPDPIAFGRIPDPSDGLARFDVFISEDIKACDLVPIDASGVTLPGEIRLKHNFPLGGMDTLTAHELFHMLQWNYAELRDSSCGGMIEAYLWYTNDSAWLMESTATWIEDEIYPDANDYLQSIFRYTRAPEISLFARTSLAPFHEYGAVVYIKFLQEHLAGPAGYSNRRDIIRSIWERVSMESNSTVDAVTYVLMNPPSGASPYSDFIDTWKSTFDDFAVANYLNNYADGSRWPANASVKIVDEKKPIADPSYPVKGNQPGFGWPAAQYIEVLPDDLNLPGGTDATGATLQLDFETSCPICTLDVLAVPASGAPSVRSSYELTETGQLGPTFGMFEEISASFGAPAGTEKLVIVFVSPVLDFSFNGFFKYAFIAIDNPPKAPEDLETLVDEIDELIELTWNEVDEDSISYKVYRHTDSPVPRDDDHLIAIVQNDDYQDASVTPNIEYHYVVTALDDGGNESDPSNEATATLPGPTPTPPPSGTTITVEIIRGADDAGPEPHHACDYSTGWNEIHFGECFDGTDITAGFRFANVQIPQGAQVQSARLEFTVDGPYSNALRLQIAGEDTGNAGSFSQSRRPDNIVHTSARVPWVIQTSDTWNLDDERQTPELSAIIQEIVNRPDWSPGNGIAIVIANDGDAGGLHRRVVGFERPLQTYSGHLTRLVVNYAGDPPPGVTLTPSPPPTATPTPPPTPTKRPCECVILCVLGGTLSAGQPSGSSVAERAPGLLLKLAPQAAELWDGVELLQQVRDQLLAGASEGDRYIDLYREHSPELALILLADPELRQQGFETIDLFRPGFEALLQGRGDEVIITPAQVSAVEQFLDEVAAAASPELTQVIAQERLNVPLGDFSGATMSATLGILTNNPPPSADAGAGYLVEEGNYVDLHGTGSDPEGDPLTFEWDLNEDGRYDVEGTSAVFAALGLDGPSTRSIALRVCDNKGGCSVSKTTVEVINAAPIVAITDGRDAAEGEAITFNGIFVDPGADTHFIEWSFGDGSESAGSLEVEHTYSDDGEFQVILSVMDDDGGKGTDSLTVHVANVPPELGLINAPADPLHVGDPIDLSAPFTDPGTEDTHVAVWDWGNGNTSAGNVAGAGGSGVVTGQHTFDSPGLYAIRLTLTDDDGGVAETTHRYLVVYDSSGGFVTGGGWIETSAGAYIPDPDLAGKANFGFVAKYKKGANVPTGQTEFQFMAAGLNLHSDRYEWLVVSGAKAIFAGTGSVNGQGGYNFMLIVMDADLNRSDSLEVDRVRFRIWRVDEQGIESVLYDTGFGSNLQDDMALSEIGGGSIVIHDK